MPPTLDRPDPNHDPDGTLLMASLRARMASGSTFAPAEPPDSRSAAYRPALGALNTLLLRRRDVGGSTQELETLERIARDLQALARGI